MSVQNAAEASQNFTCPVVTAKVPVFTVAVSVITVPDLTVVTVLLLEETTRVVVVEVGTAQLGCTVKQRIVIRMATIENWLTILPFTINLHIRLYLSRLNKIE